MKIRPTNYTSAEPMDETTNLSPIEEKLTQYLEVIEESVQAGAELASEELPLLAQEIVFAERISAGVWALVFAFAAGLMCLLARRLWSHRSLDNGCGEFSCVCWLLSVVAFIGSTYCLDVFLRAVFSPRLVIIDYIKDLL